MPITLSQQTGFIRRIFVHPLDAVVLALVWVGMNGGLYLHYGIKVVADSPRYLDYAQKIADGVGWYEPHNVWYVGYVVFIVVVKGFFATNGAIIVAQVLMHGLAAVVLYRTSYRLFASRGAALITALLFLGWIELPAWNFYVLAESWYVSLICLVLYCIISFDGSPKRWVITTVVVLLTFITKPTGIAVLVAYGVFLVSYYWKFVRQQRGAAFAILLPLLWCVYYLVNSMLDTFALIENYATGEIVFRASTLKNYPNQEWLVLQVDKLSIPPEQASAIKRLALFAAQNFIYFAKLFLVKLVYFLAHIKPYFSWQHNLVIATTLFPIYAFFIRTFVLTNNRTVRSFCTSFLVVSTISISLTTLDWEGRFLMPMLPLLFLFAGKGLSDLKPIRRFAYLRY